MGIQDFFCCIPLMRDIELVVFYIFCYYIGNPIIALCEKVPKQTMKLMLENLILSEILSGIKEQKDDICILRSNIISLASRRCNHCL